MKKAAKKPAHAAGGQHTAHPHARPAKAAFSPAHADAFQVVDELVALRGAISAMEQRPFSATKLAPPAVRRVLEIIENLNLRLAELEAGD
jgi:hypothetical protein